MCACQHSKPLNEGMAYIQFSAGKGDTVFFWSDGRAIAIGGNAVGQCDIPLLHEGTTYTQVSAGSLQAMSIQCFSGVMALLLLLDSTIMENVTSHL